MKIVKANVEFVTPIDFSEGLRILGKIEKCGRTCYKSEVVMTANLGEWRHFFRLRCSNAAHPQMREVALLALDMCRSVIPVVFDDVYEEVTK